MFRLLVAIIVNLSLLLHLSNAIQCYEGTVAVPALPAETVRGKQCPNKEDRCIRAVIVVTVGEGTFEGKIDVGRCAPVDECGGPCPQIFTNLPGVPQAIPLESFIVRSCESVCCNTDNCNDNSLRDIQKKILDTVSDGRVRSVPFRFYSLNFPSHHIGVIEDFAHVMENGTESFRLLSPGLDNTPGSVSFQLDGSTVGNFLQIQGGNLLVQGFTGDAMFNGNATFTPRFNLFYPGYDAYVSTTNPTLFITHDESKQLRIQQQVFNEEFNKRASFKAVKSIYSQSDPIRFQSLAFPTMCIGSGFDEQGFLQDCNDPTSVTLHLVSPGLDETPGSVSFVSSSDGSYLCHRIHLSLQFKSLEYSASFRKSATFIPHQNMFFPGYTSFQSVDQVLRFITVIGRILVLSPIGTDDASRENASFAGVNV